MEALCSLPGRLEDLGKGLRPTQSLRHIFNQTEREIPVLHKGPVGPVAWFATTSKKKATQEDSYGGFGDRMKSTLLVWVPLFGTLRLRN